MGGIATKLGGEFCQTSLNGLWAIGETSCISVHGANRLGGNSLLETSVFGRHVGRVITKNGIKKHALDKEIKDAEDISLKNTEKMFESWNNNRGKIPTDIRDEMKSTLDINVGVYREENKLQKAVTDLAKLQKEFVNVKLPIYSRKLNYSLIRLLELRNMIDIAEVTAFAALWRKESRGAHFRTDYPKRNDDEFLAHSLIYRTKDGLELMKKEVKLGLFEVKERKY